jgi:hypothetical protein
MAHPSTPSPRLNKLWKDSFETPLRQILMYLWKAACDRLNKRREKKEERTKREVRRMGRNAKQLKPTPDEHQNYNQDKSFSNELGTPPTG